MKELVGAAIEVGIPVHFVQVGYDRWPSVCMAALITGAHVPNVGLMIDLVAFVREGGFFFNFDVPYDEDAKPYSWHFIDDPKHHTLNDET